MTRHHILIALGALIIAAAGAVWVGAGAAGGFPLANPAPSEPGADQSPPPGD